MTYNITVTNHEPITINTGVIDNSTSLSLIGKNVPNYGQLIAQNFVRLMQNFAGTSVPNGGIDGQLYYDTNINALRLCQGGEFRKILTSITSSAGVQPSSNNIGDLWWDTNAVSLKLYNGSSWTTIGPQTDTIIPSIDNTYDIGSSLRRWRTVYGTSVKAQYADLAEKYHSDQVYASGTIMKIGGSNEITLCDEENSYDVFGVISTAPAYLMNDNTQDELWLPVVLIGRCPVNVIGPVRKGQRLVSAGNGYAKASDNGVCFRTVLGRSLVNKTSETAELIECYINTN
jgi:hypothetical protein